MCTYTCNRVYAHVYARMRIRTYRPTHVYRVARKWCWSLGARATRSIRHVASCASTPRNVGAPLPRCPCLSFLSLSPSFSAVSSRSYLPELPLYTVADVFGHPRGKGRYGGNGLSGRPKTRGRKYSAQQNFSTRSRMVLKNPVTREHSEQNTAMFREILSI